MAKRTPAKEELPPERWEAIVDRAQSYYRDHIVYEGRSILCDAVDLCREAKDALGSRNPYTSTGRLMAVAGFEMARREATERIDYLSEPPYAVDKAMRETMRELVKGAIALASQGAAASRDRSRLRTTPVTSSFRV